MIKYSIRFDPSKNQKKTAGSPCSVVKRVVQKELSMGQNKSLFQIAFDAQIENAIRLNKILLFYCSKYKSDRDSWLKMVEFGKTGDIFSLISIERALKVIDPRGYLTTKHKVKATAVIELQKRFQKAKVVLVQDCEESTDCVTIRVNKWTEQDWVDYLQYKTKHLSIDDNCKTVSHFIANLAKEQFSPSPSLRC